MTPQNWGLKILHQLTPFDFQYPLKHGHVVYQTFQQLLNCL
ncbi:hypothetical protein CHCC20347_2822 [Bacillus paralicheniformis]|nr:hypothetical protein CHCC20347_2822 [Bacillus paralicheniformis]